MALNRGPKPCGGPTPLLRPGKRTRARSDQHQITRGRLPTRDRGGGDLQGIAKTPTVGRYAASEIPTAGGVRKLRNGCTETPESSTCASWAPGWCRRCGRRHRHRCRAATPKSPTRRVRSTAFWLWPGPRDTRARHAAPRPHLSGSGSRTSLVVTCATSPAVTLNLSEGVWWWGGRLVGASRPVLPRYRQALAESARFAGSA